MRKLLVALGGLFLCLAANAQNGAIGSLTAQGADCTTAGACISLQFDINDVASASIQLSGTFTATVQFEASSDKGTTWVAISGTPLNSSTAVTSATTANTWKFNMASLTNIRARCSAWTSAPTVVIRSSRAVANAIGGGGGTSLPALSDNGTVVTSTEPLVLPVGAVALASNSIQFGANGGLYSPGASAIRFSTGADRVEVGIQGIVVNGNGSNQFASSSTNAVGSPDTFLRSPGVAQSWVFGKAASATPLTYTVQFGESGTGADKVGGSGHLLAGIGTGAGAGTQFDVARDLAAATSSTLQSTAHAFVVCESKTLSNTSATAQALANIALSSNSAGGASGFITVTATDGTNFDSETQSFNVSYVNKATVGTVGTAVITSSTAANNSGSATIGMTATFAGTTLSIKATPVFTTIVPTTVTAYIEVMNHGAGAVTCQ